METGKICNFDFVQVADFYIDGFFLGGGGTPRCDTLEAFIASTKAIGHESEELLRLKTEFYKHNFNHNEK